MTEKSHIKTVILRANSSISHVLIPKDTDTDNLDVSKLGKIFKKKGTSKFEHQCAFQLDADNSLSIFAWSDGKAGDENKHDLPPPLDEDLFFGDILVVKSNKGKIEKFHKTDYDEFYELAHGGFEDLGDEDSDDDDDGEPNEYDENDSFIASENSDLDEEEEEEESEFSDFSETEEEECSMELVSDSEDELLLEEEDQSELKEDSISDDKSPKKVKNKDNKSKDSKSSKKSKDSKSSKKSKDDKLKEKMKKELEELKKETAEWEAKLKKLKKESDD